VVPARERVESQYERHRVDLDGIDGAQLVGSESAKGCSGLYPVRRVQLHVEWGDADRRLEQGHERSHQPSVPVWRVLGPRSVTNEHVFGQNNEYRNVVDLAVDGESPSGQFQLRLVTNAPLRPRGHLMRVYLRRRAEIASTSPAKATTAPPGRPSAMLHPPP